MSSARQPAVGIPFVIIQKRGGQEVEVEAIGFPGRCRSCGADVYFVETANGKHPPFNADGITHFATCPQAEEWRGKAKAPAAKP